MGDDFPDIPYIDHRIVAVNARRVLDQYGIEREKVQVYKCLGCGEIFASQQAASRHGRHEWARQHRMVSPHAHRSEIRDTVRKSLDRIIDATS